MNREQCKMQESPFARNRYPVLIKFPNEECICLWGHGTSSFDDFFIVDEDGLIATFSTYVAAERYVGLRGLLFVNEESELDCVSSVIVDGSYVECKAALNRWNTFGDAAHSIKEPFFGDEQSDHSLMTNIYSKLFAGSNLPVIVEDNEPYVPVWRPGELMVVSAVLDQGHTILRKALGLEALPPLEAPRLEAALAGPCRTWVSPEFGKRCVRAARIIEAIIAGERRCAVLAWAQGHPVRDEGDRLPSFDDADSAARWAQGVGIVLEEPVAHVELLPASQGLGPGEPSRRLARAWEAMSAVAAAAERPFPGDLEDGIVDVCYRDLLAEADGAPHSWTVADLMVVYCVLDEGWRMLGDALGFQPSVVARALSEARATQEQAMLEIFRSEQEGRR